ncbi:bifunctional [glutamine synthetase] adenylyltransferase/[glutamine synthetase]-adenylyl-L-tyrosine phosphorylase [Kordiimonas pumila]|uniref:Bifunctional [glutamine synthetase] adenylyltransferase/[glutamine synthetase]-adenylyl-L-tyrosine phosphorylase n=1 Tax=Kordiimonas pumila TaxID=2161677 RepID=A0ABV7D207_9PROT|nr:bifunctional [glutamine synthetase] adenylyltransferase/[glutamine synthetase]-adenylyl-L-tyrosine phosphorylase [Kordiimonas pumila]
MTIQTSPYPHAYDTQKADEIWVLLNNTVHQNEQNGPDKNLADAIFGNSPYLANIAERFPDFALKILKGDSEHHFLNIMDGMKTDRPEGETRADFMAFLRNQKAFVSFLVAVADIAGWWHLQKITKALSDFADMATELALAHLLHDRMVTGELPWPKNNDKAVNVSLAQNCGYFILGMGKLGAGELNYSSDIDLIALYDPEQITYSGTKSIATCFVKITQELMQILEQRTMHGYVFRTDLRLRPDPSATPLAISVSAAENYYHSMAVNWERSAMIKARVIAGDKAVGADYLKNMAAWVWRKSRDFAALTDIAAIKNQINRHYDQKPEYKAGFNVKLGHGGIREIEFYAQINQLLHAGRHPELRVTQTLNALDELSSLGFIPPEIEQALRSAYIFLRTLEHRLQMIDDAQTHSIPNSDKDILRIALFTGYESPEKLLFALKEHCETVSQIYDQLMPEENTPEDKNFTGPELAKTLETLSYSDISGAMAIIAGWRQGRYKALNTERAKKLLEKCLPKIVTAFSSTYNPSAALARFDGFVSQLPAGVQLFSLLHSNPSLFKLLARVMGLAPALAETLSKKPQLWDMVLEPHFFLPVEDEAFLQHELENMLSSAYDFQDVLDITRKYVAEQKFRTGIHLLESIASTEEIGAALARIADVVLKALVPRVCTEFARRHGAFPGGGIGILAMGKYGGSELTHTSDLDIIFLYHTKNMDAVSDGEKPLTPSLYFSRLGQNIITAITALTPEGRLFEVDTRLRPSGSQGPLVVTLKTFEEYYTTSAWTWEHMALTRARIILAPEAMKAPLTKAVMNVLTQPRDTNDLLLAVADMREKLFSQFGSTSIWSIKHCRGGMIDMEFICQYLLLKEGAAIPSIFHSNLTKAIKRLETAKVLHKQDATLLLDAQSYEQKIQSILRLCLGSSPKSSDEIAEGLQQVLIDATKAPNFEALEKTLKEKQHKVFNLYKKLIEHPVKATF